MSFHIICQQHYFYYLCCCCIIVLNNYIEGVKIGVEEQIPVLNNQKIMVFKKYKVYDSLKDFESDDGNFMDKDIELNLLQNEAVNPIHNVLFNSKTMNLEKWIKYKFNEDDIPNNEMIISRFKKEDKDYDTYALKNASGLYTEMGKINPFSNKDILHFSKVFGLPYGSSSFEDIPTVINGDHYPLSIQYVQMNILINALLNYVYIFNVFKNIVTLDTSSIINRDYETLPYRYINYHPTNDAEVLNSEKEFFSHLIKNYNILNLDLTFNYFQENEFILEHSNLELIDYAVFQMVKALVYKSTFKHCENCGHIFEVTHEKMRFCPPMPFRKRSSCEMAYRNRMRNK